MDKALEEANRQYALGEKTNDIAVMTGDLQLKGNVVLEMGRPDEAKALFERGLKMTEESTLSQETKDNAKLFHHYNLAHVAIVKKDLPTASTEAEAYRKGTATLKNPFQTKLAHELMDMIALAARDYSTALAKLQQANQQNPYDLYRQCQARRGIGKISARRIFAPGLLLSIPCRS